MLSPQVIQNLIRDRITHSDKLSADLTSAVELRAESRGQAAAYRDILKLLEMEQGPAKVVNPSGKPPRPPYCG